MVGPVFEHGGCIYHLTKILHFLAMVGDSEFSLPPVRQPIVIMKRRDTGHCSSSKFLKGSLPICHNYLVLENS